MNALGKLMVASLREQGVEAEPKEIARFLGIQGSPRDDLAHTAGGEGSASGR
jgi:hypothetical protein